MTPYLPHTSAEVDAMLRRIGVSSLEELFKDIPPDLRLKEEMGLPPSHAESEALAALGQLAEENQQKILFLGGGHYDHLIPSVVGHLGSLSSFVTAYTPYQAEISQGMLQALFEFQSAMAEITGLDVANASLYDGFTAAAEGAAMALNAKGKKGRIILTAATLHPFTKSVLNTYFSDLDVEIRELPESKGIIPLDTLKEALTPETAGVLVQTPNFYGRLEDLRGWADCVHQAGARLIISAHPLSLGALCSPGEWGADIAVGDNQPLGLAPNFGGPSAGYITCTRDLMRRMPGRIVGETVDKEGRRAFVLTLQAREQHIKRERATSNICTNQSLTAVANLIYLTALGPRGFQKTAERCIQNAAYLKKLLLTETPLKEYAPGPLFNEFTLRIPVPREQWLAPFHLAGVAPGFYPGDLDPALPKDLFTLAVTEARSQPQMDQYLSLTKEALL